MTATPDRTVAEIVKEYGIPKDFEGCVKYMQDQFVELMKRAGRSEEDARAKSEALGAQLVRPDVAGPGAEKFYANRNDFDEKRLLGDLVRFEADKSGGRRIRRLAPEKMFQEVNEAISRGAFGGIMAKLVSEGKVDKTISDASHANAIMTAYSQEYITNRYLVSRFAGGEKSAARNFPMTQSTLKVPKLTSRVTIKKHTRGTSETPDDPAIGQVTLTSQELQGDLHIPNETLRDASGALLEVLLSDIGIQMKIQMLTYFAIGTGTGDNEPLGIENGTYTKEVAVDGNVNWRHLVKAVNTLGDQWVEAADELMLCWVMNQAVKEVSQLIEDDSGRPMFVRLETTPITTVGATAPTMQPQAFAMLGIPGIVLPALTGLATPSSPAAMYLMAARAAYYTGTREDFNLFVSEHVEAKANSTYIRGTAGYDGQVAQADAVCVLSGIEG